MHNLLLPLNLQFFAEGEESDETPEVVAPEESVSEDGEPEEGEEAEPAEQPEHVQSAEENANYANIRRKAEADANRRYEERQRSLDAMYAQMFQGYKNPETGQPIQTAADYIAAMAAQERQMAESKMQEAGIDRDSLNRLIENNPTVIQAKQAIQSLNEQNAEKMVQEDLEQILAIEPELGNIEAVTASEGYNEAVQYAVDHPGIRLSDAYKIVNFERLANSKTATARQAAINAQRSKEHLSQTAGIATNDNSLDIPSSELEKWKDWFPDKSPKELRKMYNKAIGG